MNENKWYKRKENVLSTQTPYFQSSLVDRGQRMLSSFASSVASYIYIHKCDSPIFFVIDYCTEHEILDASLCEFGRGNEGT